VDTRDKIVTSDQLARIADSIKSRRQTLVLTHGVFDVVHPGHVRHFESARRHGDALAVAVVSDRHASHGPHPPFFNQRLRAESLAALQMVDYVLVVDSPSPVGAIRKVRPGVYLRGIENGHRHDAQTEQLLAEERAVSEVGGRIEGSVPAELHSSRTLNTHFPAFSDQAASFLKEFRKRHDADDVIGRLSRPFDLRAMVVGDAIIDEYHFCRAVGKASKSANVTARSLYSESYAGGAVAVANHAAEFCKEVRLVTCLGEASSHQQFLRDSLRPNVEPIFFLRPDGPTVVKRRFVDPFMLSKMFEVCFLNDQDLPQEIERHVCDDLIRTLPDYQVAIVCDFGHGFITERMVRTLCRHGQFLALNTQTNSQNFGFNLATKYPRADYLSIDEQEARLAVHDKYGRLERIMVDLCGRLGSTVLSVTRGGRGSLTYDPADGFLAVPTFSDQVVDTVGAGDAYLSVTALCAAAGEPADVLGLVGNAVGALAVRIVGNKEPVRRGPLCDFLAALLR
jgi:cytidyltransferase-like protein